MGIVGLYLMLILVSVTAIVLAIAVGINGYLFIKKPNDPRGTHSTR